VVTDFYKGLYEDLSLDREESAELISFFNETHPPEVAALTQTRALAFKVACDFLGDDKDTNVQLMRCINVVVHAFEQTCLQPKQFQLILPESVDLSMSLQDAIQHLWNLDANRLTPDEDYVIDVQKGKKPYWKEDSAPEPLFTSVDRQALKRPTYAAFCALLDNYSAEVGIAENVTQTERREVKTFLKAVLNTPPMQFCHKYCHAHGKAPQDTAGFSKLLHNIWFDLYNRKRGGRPDSSGFEHVFIGEAKDGDVSGFHNWIQFYLEEQRGKVDYRGYLKPKSRGDAASNSNDHVLTIQFNWGGVEKFAGTFFGKFLRMKLRLFSDYTQRRVSHFAQFSTGSWS
jgi:poly(U)-specific endoribonuclease